MQSYTYKININESVKEQLSQLPKPWSETTPKQLTIQVNSREVILIDDQGFATRLDLITEKLEFLIQKQRVEGELSLAEILKPDKSGFNNIATLRMRSKKTFKFGRQDLSVQKLRFTSKKDGSTFDITDSPDIRVPVPALRLIYALLIPGVQYKASYGFPVSIEVADADQQKLVTATLVKKKSGKLPAFEDFLSMPVTKKSIELEKIEWNSNKNKARELPDTKFSKKILSEKAVQKGVLPSLIRAKSPSAEKQWFYSFLLNFVQIYHGAEVGLGIRNGAFETLRNVINPLLNIGNFSAFRIGNSEQLIFSKNFYFDIAQQFATEYRDLIPQWIVLAYLMTGGEPLLQSEATPDGLDLEAQFKLERLPRLLEEFQFVGFDPIYSRPQWEMPDLVPGWVREIRDNVTDDSAMSQENRDLLQWLQYTEDADAMRTLLQNIHYGVKSLYADISPDEIKQLTYVVILDILRNDLIAIVEAAAIRLYPEVYRVLLFRNNEAESKDFIDTQLSALLTFSDTLTMKSSRIGGFGMEIEIHTPSLLSVETSNSMIRSISHTGDGGIRLHINIPTLRYHSHLQLHFDLLTVIGTIAGGMWGGWAGLIIGAGTLLSLKIPRPIYLLAQNIDVHLLLRREAVHDANFETGWGFRPSLSTPGFGVIINNLGMDNTRGIDIPGHIIDAVLTSGSVFAGKLAEGLEKELYKLFTTQPDWLVALGQIDYFAPVKRLLPWPSIIHFDGLYLKLSVPECSSDTCFEVLWAQVRSGEMNEAGIQDVDLTDVDQLCIIMNRATLSRWFYGFTQLLQVDEAFSMRYGAEAWANDVGLGDVDIDLLPEPEEAVRDRGDLPMHPEIKELFGTDSPSRPPAGGRTIRFLRLTVGRDVLTAAENDAMPNDRAMELAIDYSIRLDAVLEQSVWVAQRVETQTPRWQLPVNEEESDTAPGYEHGGEPTTPVNENDPSSANWDGPNSPDPNDLVTTVEYKWRRTRRQYILETLLTANVSVRQGLVFGFEKAEASESSSASGLSIEFPSLVLALKRDGDNVLTDASIDELNAFSDTININEDFLRQYCIADTQKMLYEMPVLNNKNLYNNKATGAWALTDIIPAQMLVNLPNGLRNARLVQSVNGPAAGEAWSDNQTFHYLHRDDSIIWPVNIELDLSELFVS